MLRFAEIAATEVRIEGRHLDTLYDLVGQHRCSWAWQWPTGKGFADPHMPVVAPIAIKPIDGFPKD